MKERLELFAGGVFFAISFAWCVVVPCAMLVYLWWKLTVWLMSL